MRRAFVLAVLFAGCFFAPDRPAAHGGDAGGDAAPDAAPCVQFTDWSGPIPITSLSGSDFAEDPALSPDGTKLVFTRTDSISYARLYMASVSGTTFGAATMIFDDNSNSATWAPSGAVLYFVHNASRSTATFDGTGFASAIQTFEFSGLPNPPEGRVTFAGDGSAVYYQFLDTGSASETHIFRAVGTVGMSWTFDRSLSELDTGSAQTGAPMDQETPWISADELAIFFATSNGNAQLRTATRATRTGSFGAPAPIVASQVDGWRPTVARDGRLMVYTDGAGQLFYATRGCR